MAAEGVQGSASGAGAPLRCPDLTAAQAKALARDNLRRDAALVDYLSARVHAKLLSQGDVDEVARRLVACVLHDATSIELLAARFCSDFTVSEETSNLRGWRHVAFQQSSA